MPEHDHDEIDGCTCDHTIPEHGATPDDELPPSTGGVEVRKTRRRPTKTAVGEDA